MIRLGLRALLMGVALLFGLTGCSSTTLGSGDAVARRVYVIGQVDRALATHVAEKTAPYLGVPLLKVDIQGIADDLRTLPWLGQFSVDRHWPDGVIVRVEAHKPIALWGDAQVLTSDFTVVTPDRQLRRSSLAELPRLVGPKGTGKRVYTRYENMNQRLMAASNVAIASLQLDARGSWRATLNNGLVLRFGRQHLVTRLQRFIDYALQGARTALQGAGYVDLRYSDGFAVGGSRRGRSGEQE